MKKLILTLVISCCMIILLIVPVLATSYTWTQGGNATQIKYNTESLSEATILNAINEACGTTENVYYICRYDPSITDSFKIFIMLDIVDAGIKGNVGYVFDDDHGLYTNSFNTIPHWKNIYISNNGTYISRYSDTGGSPWNFYPNSGKDQYGACVVFTNMPIFRTKEGIDDYFSTGSSSDMIGAEPEYDVDVPHPTDVYLTYKVTESCITDQLLMKDKDNLAQMRDFDVNLYYQLPDEAADCDVKVFYTANTRTYKWKSILKGGIYKLDILSPLISSVERSYISGENCVKKSDLVDNEKVIDYLKVNASYQAFTRSSVLGQETLITGYTFYIYCQRGNKKGDVISVSVDMSMFKVGDDFQKTPLIAPSDVNKFNGSNSLEDIVNGNVPIEDSYHVGDYEVNNININLVDNIKSLFGLVGENGLIPMLSEVFSFLPAPIVIIMISTFSAVAAVIVLKFVRG